MAIDADSPEGKMFRRLAQELHDRRTGRVGSAKWNRDLLRNKVPRPPLDLLDAYFRGDPPLRSDIHSQVKPYVRAFLRAGRYNIAELTVVSTSNRMDLRDFRTAAANDEQGDLEARRVMVTNEWNQLARQVHDYMLSMGDGYTITTPVTDAIPRVTAEDPRQVITAHDAMTGETLAGLKVYRDDWDEADFAYMAWRDGSKVWVQKLRHGGRSTITDGPFRFDGGGWETDGEAIESPFGVMPFQRFRNRDGVGEFERHIDTLDRINDKVFNEWWISKIQAFRQRAIKNLPDTEQKRDPETGKIVEVEIDYKDMFTAAPDEMWQVPEGVDFWESQPIDLTPITASVQKDLERYAAAVSQPLHTITPDAANGSAEGASLMREEHLFKIEDRIGRVDRRWCAVMADCFKFMGDDAGRDDVTQIESVWGPAERFSLAQRADAASKLAGILPVEAIWTEVLQYRPADVPNLRALKGRDQVYNAAQG